MVEEASNIHEQCNTQLNVVQIPSFEKEVQSCSPSGCVDQYLADPVEVDCTPSAHKQLQLSTEAPQVLQSGYTDPKETIKKVEDAVNSSSTREAGALTSSDQAKKNLCLSSLKLDENVEDLRNDESFNVFLKITSENVNDIADSDVNLNPVSGVQHSEQYAAQVNVGIDYIYIYEEKKYDSGIW
jgi:hypothetical protein